jgi:lysozyme family protein
MTELDRFHVCLPYVLAQECPFPDDWSNGHNFSHDAHDPGGATMCGIIQREYDIYRKHKGLGTAPVRRDEGEEIYEANYWLPECPKLPIGLDLSFFDMAVNAGPHGATRILQRALDIESDGLWGPQTDLAIRGIFNLRRTINGYRVYRESYYRALSGFRYFGTGWTRRAEEIGATSLKMADER